MTDEQAKQLISATQDVGVVIGMVGLALVISLLTLVIVISRHP